MACSPKISTARVSTEDARVVTMPWQESWPAAGERGLGPLGLLLLGALSPARGWTTAPAHLQRRHVEPTAANSLTTTASLCIRRVLNNGAQGHDRRIKARAHPSPRRK